VIELFATRHRSELLQEQQTIELIGGIKYPLMKLADMYFWQIGAGISDLKQNTEDLESVPVGQSSH